MAPATSAELPALQLREHGVMATRYLERFGGFGKFKEHGFIVWQVAMVMDFMQAENYLAAKDAVALLFVFMEQLVMDNGKMEVAALLALIEDPPQSLFSNRAFSMGARPRAFAATADQKWVTVALQYLKELDVIQTKRVEATKDKKQDTPTSDPLFVKKKKKGGGKGKKQEEDPVD